MPEGRGWYLSLAINISVFRSLNSPFKVTRSFGDRGLIYQSLNFPHPLLSIYMGVSTYVTSWQLERRPQSHVLTSNLAGVVCRWVLSIWITLWVPTAIVHDLGPLFSVANSQHSVSPFQIWVDISSLTLLTSWHYWWGCRIFWITCSHIWDRGHIQQCWLDKLICLIVSLCFCRAIDDFSPRSTWSSQGTAGKKATNLDLPEFSTPTWIFLQPPLLKNQPQGCGGEAWCLVSSPYSVAFSSHTPLGLKEPDSYFLSWAGSMGWRTGRETSLLIKGDVLGEILKKCYFYFSV